MRDNKELLFFLALRDVQIRYKQTLLGASWAVIQPLFTMVVFSIFFGALAGVPSDGLPYPLFALSALVPWSFFANGLTHASSSVVKDASLITKVYFPRAILPVAAILAGLVDFALASVVLVVMMLFYPVAIGGTLLALPLLVVLLVAVTLGVGLWLAALNAQFRDVGYVTPFLIQFWLFLTPIAYPTSLLSEGWKVVYGLNPMVGVVEGFRWALLGSVDFPQTVLITSVLISLLLLVTGLFYFRSAERLLADVV